MMLYHGSWQVSHDNYLFTPALYSDPSKKPTPDKREWTSQAIAREPEGGRTIALCAYRRQPGSGSLDSDPFLTLKQKGTFLPYEKNFPGCLIAFMASCHMDHAV